MRISKNNIIFFSLPRKFEGIFDIIQTNAITSRTQFIPTKNIVLFGDDQWTKEICEDLWITHHIPLQYNFDKVPYFSYLLQEMCMLYPDKIICYINSDIIITSNFIEFIENTEIPFENFMISWHRRNIEVKEFIDFSKKSRETVLHKKCETSGKKANTWDDFFIFPSFIFKDIPILPYIMRPFFDNFMIYICLRNKIPLIDATNSITTVHQKHDYNYYQEAQKSPLTRKESLYNLNLIGLVNSCVWLFMAPYKTNGFLIEHKKTKEIIQNYLTYRRYIITARIYIHLPKPIVTLLKKCYDRFF